jgi:hypothetical protein
MEPLVAPTITIRLAHADDDAALARLAALDSADRLPDGQLLLAEANGEVRAALALGDGSVLADPFFATAGLVSLLRRQAEAVAGPRSRRRSRQRRRVRARALRVV